MLYLGLVLLCVIPSAHWAELNRKHWEHKKAMAQVQKKAQSDQIDGNRKHVFVQ